MLYVHFTGPLAELRDEDSRANANYIVRATPISNLCGFHSGPVRHWRKDSRNVSELLLLTLYLLFPE